VFPVDDFEPIPVTGTRPDHVPDQTAAGGGFNWCGLAALLIAGTVGLRAVTSTSPVFSWVGYLLRLMGGKTGAVGGSSIGVVIALLLGALAYWMLTLATGQLSKARLRRPQPSPVAPAP
jgi:hypothetical protein